MRNLNREFSWKIFHLINIKLQKSKIFSQKKIGACIACSHCMSAEVSGSLGPFEQICLNNKYKNLKVHAAS